MKLVSDITCIDLFCGAGGLTHGLRREGIDVVAGFDVDEACRHPYSANNDATFFKEDVARVTSGRIDGLFGDARVRVLAGCAPCQPFSTYSRRYDTLTSPRWGLLYQFARLVKKSRPDLVTMENVPLVTRHEVFDDFIRALERIGYHVWSDVVDCSEHGLPQKRRRMVILASLHGPIELASPSARRPKTVRDAIGDLRPITQGGSFRTDPMHTAASLSELNLERIRASTPGGTWRDWPEHLIAACHRRKTGKTYPSVYGRMSWDEPSPALTTQFFGFGNGRFGHPEQDRALSLREGAILQGFPKTYSFVPDDAPIEFRTMGRMIGNAVPVTLGRVIGRSILAHLGMSAVGAGKKKRGASRGDRRSLVA